MARTFQVTEVFPELTVRENIRVGVESGTRACAPACGCAGPSAVRVEEAIDAILVADRPHLQGRPPGRRTRARRPALCRDRRGARPASRACCCWTNRPPAWASRKPTQVASLIRRLHRQQRLHHRADRARHARGVQSCRPHLGARPRPPAGGRHAAGNRRQRRTCRQPTWERQHERAGGEAGSTPFTARATSCTTCRLPSPKAASPRCSGAMAPARPPRCAA